MVLPPGEHRLSVRCRTASGRWQDPEPTEPYPTGATGLHVVEVHASRSTTAHELRPVPRSAAATSVAGRVVRVGVTQMEAPVGDVDARLEQAGRLVAACAADGARWVVLPEFFSTGVADNDEVRAGASTPGGAPVRLLADLARRHGVHLTASLLLTEGSRVRNAQLVHDPSGALVARHDKDLPTMWENALYEGGDPGDDGVAVVDDVPVGLALCWELTRSRTVRRLAGRVDVVLAGSGWWSIPDDVVGPLSGPLRPLVRRWQLENRRRAHDAPAVLAQHVGAPVVHAAHTGRFTSAAAGMPGGRYTGEYVGGTGVWAGDGSTLAVVAPDAGEASTVVDVEVGRQPATRRPSGFWLTEPGPVPRYAWTVQRRAGRRDYAARAGRTSA